MRWAALALALLAVGCDYGGDKREFLVDSEFHPAHVDEIREAMQQWTLAADCPEVELSIVGTFDDPIATGDDVEEEYEGPGRIFRVTRSDPVWNSEVMPRRVLGLYKWPADNIAVRTEGLRDNLSVRRIMLHEVGHLLGLEHTPVGLMRPGGAEGDGTYGDACISQYELDALCELYPCGPDARPTCVNPL